MKKTISWWVLLVIAAISYFLKYAIGGIIGDVLGLFTGIMLALAIVRGIATIFGKKKEVPENK